jgi:hypothetical protein
LPGFAGVLWDQILAALEKNVRAPMLAGKFSQPAGSSGH